MGRVKTSDSGVGIRELERGYGVFFVWYMNTRLVAWMSFVNEVYNLGHENESADGVDNAPV
jgi:hypothetical protein